HRFLGANIKSISGAGWPAAPCVEWERGLRFAVHIWPIEERVMPFERHSLRIAALAAVMLGCSPALAGDDPTGVWMSDTGRGAVEIKDCGGKLCGVVVWVKDATDAEGCGRQIIGDLVKGGGNAWGGDSAWIYSPEKKKTFNVEVTPLADGTLKVKGYAG